MLVPYPWLVLVLAALAMGLETRVEPFGTNSIRVRVAPPGGSIAEPIMPALLPKAPESRSAWRATASGVENGNLRVEVDDNGLITASRVSDGKVLLKQSELTFDAPSPGARKGSVAVTATFAGGEGESYYGLGEHSTGTVAIPPQYTKVFADSLYYGKSHGSDVSVPWYFSTGGYGFVWNLPSLGSVAVNGARFQWVSNATLGVDVWITAGQPAELLRQYADAVGHARPMPYWTSGFIQCKDRYRNQSQLLSVARGYVDRGLPISMIVIDWFHWVQMGDWALNPTCWPDPAAMVAELRSMGIELMVTFWPFMGQNVSKHWKEYRNNGYLAVNATSGEPDSIWQYRTPTGNSLVDPTNPDAMQATYSHWVDGYGKYGIRALWLDEAEPDHAKYISGGQWKLHSGSDAEVLPSWVKYWTKGFHDGMMATGRDDFFLLSRNAWAGTPAFGAALWSGDISSTWGALRDAVTAGQMVGLSGIPLWTTDIGGYGGGDPSSPDFQELIVRWFQFGAFCPLFRLHGHRGGGPPEDQCGPTNGDNEVWNLAPQEDHYDAIVSVMKLREQLRGYVMQVNNESVQTGMPMMRAMALQFPDDPVCGSNQVEQQFMFGEDWLIAPVTSAKARSWPVYLPDVSPDQWVYHWNLTVLPPGHHTVDVSAIGHFPLFRRSSSP